MTTGAKASAQYVNMQIRVVQKAHYVHLPTFENNNPTDNCIIGVKLKISHGFLDSKMTKGTTVFELF